MPHRSPGNPTGKGNRAPRKPWAVAEVEAARLEVDLARCTLEYRSNTKEYDFVFADHKFPGYMGQH